MRGRTGGRKDPKLLNQEHDARDPEDHRECDRLMGKAGHVHEQEHCGQGDDIAEGVGRDVACDGARDAAPVREGPAAVKNIGLKDTQAVENGYRRLVSQTGPGEDEVAEIERSVGCQTDQHVAQKLMMRPHIIPQQACLRVANVR